MLDLITARHGTPSYKFCVQTQQGGQVLPLYKLHRSLSLSRVADLPLHASAACHDHKHTLQNAPGSFRRRIHKKEARRACAETAYMSLLAQRASFSLNSAHISSCAADSTGQSGPSPYLAAARIRAHVPHETGHAASMYA